MRVNSRIRAVAYTNGRYFYPGSTREGPHAPMQGTTASSSIPLSADKLGGHATRSERHGHRARQPSPTPPAKGAGQGAR